MGQIGGMQAREDWARAGFRPGGVLWRRESSGRAGAGPTRPQPGEAGSEAGVMESDQGRVPVATATAAPARHKVFSVSLYFDDFLSAQSLHC